MNLNFVRFLIKKDLYLFRWPILAYCLGAIISLCIASINRTEMFYLGCILLLTVLISLSIHIAFGMILEERTRKTLPFVLSLPVTPREYMLAKGLASLSVYLIPWSIVMIGMWISILIKPTLPNGVAPFFSIVIIELLAAAMVLITVALLTESMAWSIATMVANNIFINLYLPAMGRMESIQNANKSETITWPNELLIILVIEIAVIALAFASAMFFQKYKRNYIQ
jgi:ABC-2 type transport system permease protein